MPDPGPDRSYRALLAVPMIGRALLGMQVARVAQAMVGVAMVLFALDRYHSPSLAGALTFVGIAPGLLLSPIAGALLDRHGRVRLVVADFVVGLASLVMIGILGLADALPVWLLLLIAGLSSLTGPLSATGLRSLFPLMTPDHLWERLNAIDSNGYVVASIIGPPIAAGTVAVFGGPAALILTGGLYGLAAIVVAGVPDPATETHSTGRLLADAAAGLRYAWSNRTIRGLGFSITTLNLAGGMLAIVVPLLILDRLGLDETVVGLVFAVQGLVGTISGLGSGRLDTRGRERALLIWPMALWAPAVALLLVPGLWPIVLAMAIMGVLNGPMDIAMFTLRQRRTDPAWIGRAFAVSMSFNFAGYPVGSAIAGWLAGWSIEAAIVLGVVATSVAAFLAWRFVPADEARA